MKKRVQEPFGELMRLLKPFALPFGLEYFLLIFCFIKKKLKCLGKIKSSVAFVF